MKIYSNGKDRVITGNFPSRFKLLNAGVEVPFIRTGKQSVRISGDIPLGVLDVEEVIRKKKIKPSKLDTSSLAIVNKADFERIDVLSKVIANEQSAVNNKIAGLVEKDNSLEDLSIKNVQAIYDTNNKIIEMAKAFGKEIQADRDALKATSENIKQVLSETAEVLDAKLQAHEVAKNPHKITKATVGLDAVDNTSDLDKPISNATKKALDKKANKADIEELDKKIAESAKKQESFQKSFENSNLYGGVGGDIIRGGKEGQILSKASNMDGDYKWVDAESGIEIIRVDELPDEGRTNVLYLVPSADPDSSNIYDEYIWVLQDDDSYGWEKIGSTKIDLSGYATEQWVEDKGYTKVTIRRL